jgi:hypothetical protein
MNYFWLVVPGYAANHKVPGTDSTVEQPGLKKRKYYCLPARPLIALVTPRVKANKSQLVRYDI